MYIDQQEPDDRQSLFTDYNGHVYKKSVNFKLTIGHLCKLYGKGFMNIDAKR